MKIVKGLRVRLDYEIRVKGGEVIESSAKTGALDYIQGDGRMLPAIEKRMDGLTIGDERKGEISGAEAFGPEDKLPEMDMPRKNFPAGDKLEAGRVFEAKGPGGQPVVLKIMSVTDEKVHVRLVHPLMGKTLEYRFKVLAVTNPAPPPPPGTLELDADELTE
jgi:FKBP-type peptidyl-prolyl cis-trans isomerase 2